MVYSVQIVYIILSIKLSFGDLNWTDSSIVLPQASAHQIYATTSDNILYMVGGVDISENVLDDVYKWNPNSLQSWEYIATAPQPIRCIY